MRLPEKVGVCESKFGYTLLKLLKKRMQQRPAFEAKFLEFWIIDNHKKQAMNISGKIKFARYFRSGGENSNGTGWISMRYSKKLLPIT